MAEAEWQESALNSSGSRSRFGASPFHLAQDLKGHTAGSAGQSLTLTGCPGGRSQTLSQRCADLALPQVPPLSARDRGPLLLRSRPPAESAADCRCSTATLRSRPDPVVRAALPPREAAAPDQPFKKPPSLTSAAAGTEARRDGKHRGERNTEPEGCLPRCFADNLRHYGSQMKYLFPKEPVNISANTLGHFGCGAYDYFRT